MPPHLAPSNCALKCAQFAANWQGNPLFHHGRSARLCDQFSAKSPHMRVGCSQMLGRSQILALAPRLNLRNKSQHASFPPRRMKLPKETCRSPVNAEHASFRHFRRLGKIEFLIPKPAFFLAQIKPTILWTPTFSRKELLQDIISCSLQRRECLDRILLAL
jgi:hypothetical protein